MNSEKYYRKYKKYKNRYNKLLYGGDDVIPIDGQLILNLNNSPILPIVDSNKREQMLHTFTGEYDGLFTSKEYEGKVLMKVVPGLVVKNEISFLTEMTAGDPCEFQIGSNDGNNLTINPRDYLIKTERGERADDPNYVVQDSRENPLAVDSKMKEKDYKGIMIQLLLGCHQIYNTMKTAIGMTVAQEKVAREQEEVALEQEEPVMKPLKPGKEKTAATMGEYMNNAKIWMGTTTVLPQDENFHISSCTNLKISLEMAHPHRYRICSEFGCSKQAVFGGAEQEEDILARYFCDECDEGHNKKGLHVNCFGPITIITKLLTRLKLCNFNDKGDPIGVDSVSLEYLKNKSLRKDIDDSDEPFKKLLKDKWFDDFDFEIWLKEKEESEKKEGDILFLENKEMAEKNAKANASMLALNAAANTRMQANRARVLAETAKRLQFIEKYRNEKSTCIRYIDRSRKVGNAKITARNDIVRDVDANQRKIGSCGMIMNCKHQDKNVADYLNRIDPDATSALTEEGIIYENDGTTYMHGKCKLH